MFSSLLWTHLVLTFQIHSLMCAYGYAKHHINHIINEMIKQSEHLKAHFRNLMLLFPFLWHASYAM